MAGQQQQQGLLDFNSAYAGRRQVQSVPDEFPTIAAGDALPTYQEFYDRHLLPNVPCLIKARKDGCSGFDLSKWKISSEWVTTDGLVDIDSIGLHVETMVPVSSCEKRHFNSQECREMPFSEFSSYWKDGERREKELLYLKDWHFRRDCPDFEAYYETPAYFCSDWLNQFGSSEESDYMFVYLGPAGSWTPFHADVFGSFSWSANVAGTKEWIFYPPGQEDFLRDRNGHLMYDVSADAMKGAFSLHESSKAEYKL